MTIEDLTDYGEFGDPIIHAPYIPLSITRQTIERRDRTLITDEVPTAADHTAAQRGGMTEPLGGRQFWDSMARKIELGDILLWKSGGFFNYFLSYGIVLHIFRDIPYRVLVLNTKKNKVTLWSTFDKTILAKHDNYDIIPDRFRAIWGI